MGSSLTILPFDPPVNRVFRNGKNLLFSEQVLWLESQHLFGRVLFSSKMNRKSQKLVPLVKKAEKCTLIP